MTINTNKFHAVHDSIWFFAIRKATLLYPVVKKSVSGFEKDVNEKDRMIMACVFYKKCFDYEIHNKTSPSLWYHEKNKNE